MGRNKKMKGGSERNIRRKGMKDNEVEEEEEENKGRKMRTDQIIKEESIQKGGNEG